MTDNYEYPLDLDWSQDEMLIVMDMWQAVENYYELGMTGKSFLTIYQKFKTVIKSIGEERRIGREFETASGYSLYRCVKHAQVNQDKVTKMREGA